MSRVPSNPSIQIRPSDATERLLRQATEQTKPRVVMAHILRLFAKLGPLAAFHIVKTRLSGRSGPGGGRSSSLTLGRRTGSLARSVVGQGVLVNRLPAIRVGVLRGPSTKYVAVHEFGATIRPKYRKALAFPVDKAHGGSGRAITPAGVPRYRTARHYPGKLHFIPIHRGNVIGALVDPKDMPKNAEGKANTEKGLERMKATYLLMKKVRIPARHPIRSGLVSYLPTIVDELDKLMRDILRIDR